MKTDHGEYRRHERTGLSIPIDVQVDGQHIDAHTLNISLSGIALARDEMNTFKKNQILKINFKGLGGLSAAARVVHIGPEHVGLSLYRARFSPDEVESLISTAPLWQRLKIQARRALWTQTRRMAVLLINTWLRPILLAAVKPKFLFAAYGNRRDVETYFTPWMEKMMPPVIICGFIRNGEKRGLMVASKYLESELSEKASNVHDYLDNLQTGFSKVDRIALVGRLPNFVLKSGRSIQSPFVSGAMGTRFMIWDVARQMKELPKYQKNADAQLEQGPMGITVLGGAGRIGNQVCEDLLQLYPIVVAFDKRYEQEEILSLRGGTLIRTSSVRRLSEHSLFIGLTHHGDVIREWVNYLPAGSLIADDTHPCISLEVREFLAEHQVDTLKIVLGHEEFSMMPRMPAWNNRDIPGCLVEALVLLENKDEVANNFELFAAAATNAGFKGRLIEPLDE